MVIGNVRASGGLESQLVQDRSSTILAQSTIGLGDSVNRLAQAGFSYLNSGTDIEAVYDRRAMASEALNLDTQFLQYQTERAQEYTEYSRGRSAAPGGMTREYDGLLAEREKAFLKTVPPRFQEEYAARLAQDRATRVSSAFVAELELLDSADTATLNQGLNALGSSVKAGNVSLEEAQERWNGMVMQSALPEAQKQEFILNGKTTIQGLAFSNEVEKVAGGLGAVGDGSTGDVVAANLLPQERAVLNVIAANESPGYDVWNGGSKFTGFQDHPAATGTAPGESTAAGKYQFILGTWRAATASYQRTYGVTVPDFSPEWQDRVALHWAEVQFNKHHTGKSFRQILETAIPEELLTIRDVLGKPRSANPNDLEWHGLGLMGDQEFLSMMLGPSGIAGGGTGAAEGPNVWTDPRYADMPLETKMSYANQIAAATEALQREQATAMTLQRDTFLGQVYNAGVNGDSALLNELRQSPYWDGEAQAKENTGREVYAATQRGIAGVESSLAMGIPLTREQGGALAQVFGKANMAGIANGDAAAYKTLTGLVNRARMLPEGINDVFNVALANPATAMQARMFLASLHKGDPSLLDRSGFTQKEIADIQLFQDIAGKVGTPEQALENYNKIIDNEGTTRDPAKVAKEGAAAFTETYPLPENVIDRFEGWFSPERSSLINPAAESQLYADARQAYEEGYRIYVNAEAADAYMKTYLDKTWGITYTTPEEYNPYDVSINRFFVNEKEAVITRFPPEKFYTGADGSMDFLYTSMRAFAVVKGAQPYGIGLMADDETEKEVRAGKLPTYRVVGTDEFGAAILLPGRFGGPTLQAQQDDLMTDEARRKAALATIGGAETKVLEAQAALRNAEAAGDPAMTDFARQQITEAERAKAAAKMAAAEQGYIQVPQPDAPEAMITDGAAMLETALTNDPTTVRRLTFLTERNSKAGVANPKEAALVEIVSKELKLSTSDAQKVVQLYMAGQN
jgi:hypothetical protein